VFFAAMRISAQSDRCIRTVVRSDRESNLSCFSCCPGGLKRHWHGSEIAHVSAFLLEAATIVAARSLNRGCARSAPRGFSNAREVRGILRTTGHAHCPKFRRGGDKLHLLKLIAHSPHSHFTICDVTRYGCYPGVPGTVHAHTRTRCLEPVTNADVVGRPSHWLCKHPMARNNRD
jgi:hypothetical protein